MKKLKSAVWGVALVLCAMAGKLFGSICCGVGSRERWKNFVTYILHPICWNAFVYCNLSSYCRRMVGEMETGSGYLLVTCIYCSFCNLYRCRNSMGAGVRIHYR